MYAILNHLQGPVARLHHTETMLLNMLHHLEETMTVKDTNGPITASIHRESPRGRNCLPCNPATASFGEKTNNLSYVVCCS